MGSHGVTGPGEDVHSSLKKSSQTFQYKFQKLWNNSGINLVLMHLPEKIILYHIQSIFDSRFSIFDFREILYGLYW